MTVRGRDCSGYVVTGIVGTGCDQGPRAGLTSCPGARLVSLPAGRARFFFQRKPKHRPGTHLLNRALFRDGLVPVPHPHPHALARLLRACIPLITAAHDLHAALTCPTTHHHRDRGKQGAAFG
ncbi:MAG: hypothetical protein ACRDTD_18520 [Pseudonocardiaceae bacterium]